MTHQTAIFLCGATATGKTDLALEIAQNFPVEIISVDSALIYREMNIGTAKPEQDILQQIRHFLIDIKDPAESYSVWEFLGDVSRLAKEIQQRGHVPLLVGGTMMYFHALENGLHQLPPANEKVRQEIELEGERQGWPAMHELLSSFDAATAKRLKPTDQQRIQRAIEVYRVSGKSLTELQSSPLESVISNPAKIILSTSDRSKLHERIEKRFDQMLGNDFLGEVEALKNRGDLDLKMPSMRCVGYRQAWQYLSKEIDYDEMRYRAIVATRQLAKRQMTWLRKQKEADTVDCLNYQKSAIFKRLDEIFSSTRN